ncbi:MAG: hypothetical protein HYZ75_16395 [Elusimicrobia bacterium]|nr:hypothetical protein [Elusimicrobiota bacterium]
MAGALKETKVEFREILTTINAKLDRLVVAADRMTGELLDNRQSHMVFGAMFGDHRHMLADHAQRIGLLERRLPPTP